MNSTGGGKDNCSADDILDAVSSLLDSASQGFTEEFGGDAVKNIQFVGDANVDEEVSLTLSGDGNDDGVCEGNPACGSETLAKRKYKMEEDMCKARIARDNAIMEYMIAKKNKIDLKNEEKVLVTKIKSELAKRKHKMEEDQCKARIARDNAITECLIAEKKKIDLDIEKKVLLNKLKLQLGNRLEKLKVKSEFNLLE